MDLTATPWGYACLAVFLASYAFIVLEEPLHLRKSIPAMLAAAGIWLLVGAAFALRGESHAAAEAFEKNLLDYAELMLFLLAAMTFFVGGTPVPIEAPPAVALEEVTKGYVP